MKLNSQNLKSLLIILFSTVFLSTIIWLPFLLRLEEFYGLNFQDGMEAIFRNYDGLEYVIIAKSLYNPEIIALLPQSLPDIYYAAHFPGYSLMILLFSPLLGFLKSMLFVTLLFTFLSASAFYFLVKDFKLTNHPLLLSLIFLIIPARWLVIHTVGSSEPVFIFFIIMSLYFFLKFEQTDFKILHLKNPIKLKFLYIFLASIFGLLAQITRPPGILLFISYGIFLLFKIYQDKRNGFVSNFLKSASIYYPLLLIPMGLIFMFVWFHFTYNDFFAYFHTGDNIHLTFPPYQVFNNSAAWVGDLWLEDIVYIFILGFLGGIYLFKQKLQVLSFFVFTYLAASTLVAHRDISRYVLPIFPFILIAFERVLTSKEFRVVLVIVFLAIYLYSQNFILNNTAPFPNLEVFD
jgi:hypothetical protein